jgi:IS5 family transposase
MKYSSQHKQLVLDPCWTSLEGLPKDNRWVKLGDSLPWDKIERIYNNRLNNRHCGAGNKPARIIIGELLIKHKMNLSDRETIQAISENPYMQYILGLGEFTSHPVFGPSLFVTVRKRLGEDAFNDMSESLLKLEVGLVEEKRKKCSDKG